MASKKNSSLLGLIAFIAMFINLIYWLICIINKQGWITIGGRIIDIAQFIATIFLTIVVLVVSYDWAKGQKKIWFYFWIAFAVITVLAICIGFGSNLAN